MNASKIQHRAESNNFEIDNLDLKIISHLLKDGRASFSEIAKELDVSDGTIHVRMNKLKALGAVTGTRLTIDPKKIGFGVLAFIGISLDHASDYPHVLEKLRRLTEITDIYFTTGDFNILMKIALRSMEDLYTFLVDKVQKIDGVQSTNTQIILGTPLERSVAVI